MPEDPNPFGDDLFGQVHVRTYRETGGGTIFRVTTTASLPSVQTLQIQIRYRGNAYLDPKVHTQSVVMG